MIIWTSWEYGSELIPMPFDRFAVEFKFPDIAVCWDRDGMNELTARLQAIHPKAVEWSRRIRIYRSKESPYYAYACIGNSFHQQAFFVCDPVPHWYISQQLRWIE